MQGLAVLSMILALTFIGAGCATTGKQRPASPDPAPLVVTLPTGDQGPIPLQITQPRYPREAFEREIQGTVELELLIDTNGRVSKVRVVRSIPELDGAAIACVREWRFRPAQRAGQPVATLASAPVTFRITDKK
jgi:protein TonB